jgi:hypothetical protein
MTEKKERAPRTVSVKALKTFRPEASEMNATIELDMLGNVGKDAVIELAEKYANELVKKGIVSKDAAIV